MSRGLGMRGSPGLGRAIRERREGAGLSLRMLAEKLGVSAPYLSDVEHGRRGFADISGLASILGTTEAELTADAERLTAQEIAWVESRPDLMKMLREIRSRKRARWGGP